MTDNYKILRAFLLGAPMEAISMLIGSDAEAIIRDELRQRDSESQTKTKGSASMYGEHRPTIIVPTSEHNDNKKRQRRKEQ